MVGGERTLMCVAQSEISFIAARYLDEEQDQTFDTGS